MTHFVLASASPRRQQLLSLILPEFAVLSADLDETPLAKESPKQMTARLALAKAKAVMSNVANKTNVAVLAGDTTVALGQRILGKPENQAEAMEMLMLLSDSTHEVFTAMSLIGEDFCESTVSETLVTFRPLSKQDIKAYCESDEPFDKAGGYGIQGSAGKFVMSIDGSYSGVMGLPLWHTQQLISHYQYRAR